MIKIEKIIMTNIPKTKIPAKTSSSVINNLPVNKPAADSSVINASYSKGILNIKDKSQSILSKAEDVLKEVFLCADEKIGMATIKQDEQVIRISAGRPIQGFSGLCKDDKRACCYLNSEGEITKIYVKDNNTKEVSMLDLLHNRMFKLSGNEVEALHYYKYHPDAIHSKLRFGKDQYSGSWKDEVERVIENLSEIFNNKSKVERTTEPTILYRALQDNLTSQEIETLSTKGGIFTDKSFCSTSTSLDVARRFKGKNPILQIEFPKGGEYVDIEKIFNIDSKHWSEKELLLNKNSKFEVLGFDKENNIIKVRYIL